MKKKILIISPSNAGTIASCAYNLYKAFRKDGRYDIRFVMLYRFADGISRTGEFEHCIDKTNDGNANLSYFKKIKWIRRIKRDFNPDLSISCLYAVSVLNVLSGGTDKKVGIFHSPLAQSALLGRMSYIVSYLSYRFILNRLDKYFCVSNTVADDLKQLSWFRRKDIEVVYNVHDVDLIREKAEEDIPEENELKLFEKPSFLYIGRLDVNKAPERALDAFIKSGLASKTNLIFIGNDSDDLWLSVKEKAHRHNVSESVRYLGAKQNPYPYLKKAKALVSTSYSEGLPGVMIESLVLGVPVLTTNSSEGNWEILSVQDKYDKSLDSIVSCEDGVIVSNLSSGNSDLYAHDIENLSKGMQMVFDNEYNPTFRFEKHIKAENVISSFTNLIS